MDFFPIVFTGRGVQIRSENPPIRSEISDIRSDFKISIFRIGYPEKNRVFGSGTDRDFSKMSTKPIRKSGDPIRKPGDPIRKVRIGFGSQFLRSDIRYWTPLFTGASTFMANTTPLLSSAQVALHSPIKNSSNNKNNVSGMTNTETVKQS